MEWTIRSLKSVLLIAFILGSTFMTHAYTYDFAVGGIYYSILNKNTVCVTTGTDNYSGDIVIPETVKYGNVTYTVTGINDWCFFGCSSIYSVAIPNTITTIGEYAFMDCRRLVTIQLPNSITSIGRSAFVNCMAIKNITRIADKD